MKEAGYHVAYLATRGDFYAENATELGVDEYGLLSEQTLPPFSNHEQHFKPFNNIYNRLFYQARRNASEALDYDEIVTRGALEWLENPPKKPWVLFLPLMFPHPPFRVEEPWFSLHNRVSLLSNTYLVHCGHGIE